MRSLPKNKKVRSLNLQNDDIILVSYEKKQIKSQLKPSIPIQVTSEENIKPNPKLAGQNAIIYHLETAKDTKGFQKKVKNKKMKIILLIIIPILLALISLVLLLNFFFKGHKLQPVFNKDKLIVEKNYPINMILRYTNKRESEM